MKMKVLIVMILIIMCFTFTSCSKQTVLKPDTPVNTGWLMKLAIHNDDYEKFNKLFSEERKNIISKEKFNDMKKMITNETSFVHYELLTFTNGEMFLIRLTPEKVNGEYKIEDVIIIPNEMKEVFQDR